MDTNVLYILGVVASVITEVVKRKFGTNGYGTIAVLLIVSLVASALYYGLAQTTYEGAVFQVLIVAGAVYTYFIRNLLPPAIN